MDALKIYMFPKHHKMLWKENEQIIKKIKILPLWKDFQGNIFYLIFQNGPHFVGCSTLHQSRRLLDFKGPNPSVALDKFYYFKY
jgi:hypothetical protein